MKPYIKVATIQDAINLSKDLRKDKIVDFSIYFSSFKVLELDHEKNNVSLYVNGEMRNKIHSMKAESLFDRMLKIAKLKFLKMRDRIEQ